MPTIMQYNIQSQHIVPIFVQIMFENRGDGSEEDWDDDDDSSAMQNKAFMKWIVDNCNLAEPREALIPVTAWFLQMPSLPRGPDSQELLASHPV